MNQISQLLTCYFACSLVLGRSLNDEHRLDAIECPFPGGSSTESETECAKYSACSWSNNGCHMQGNEMAGYVVATEKEETERGFKVNLKKSDSTVTMFNQDIQELTFEVIRHEDYHLQVKIYDSSKSRYEVPFPLTLPEDQGSSFLYSVSVSDVGSPFSFSVVRETTGNAVFKSEGALSFEEQFIQFTTSLSSSFVYGFGENAHRRFKHIFESRKTTPLFSRDQPVRLADLNEYGVHPYYVNIEDDEGNTHSVLFYNSNAMEYSTFSLDDGTPAITMRTIGGIIDLHFFLGPTPEEVNVQYSAAIGRGVCPPYWALGFHLSRYGYWTLDNAKEVRERMEAARIPQDVQTFDIDYMSHYRDFTYNHESWAQFPQYIEELHQEGLKVTLILDPAIAIDYFASADGAKKDVFIKWMDKSLVPDDQDPAIGDYMVGYVFPDNKTVFPDFLKPETTKWWSDESIALHDKLNFDALWIDLNEPTNFGTNMDRPFNYPDDLPDWSLKCPSNSLEDPPYPTKASYQPYNECGRLSDRTICMSGLQTDGKESYLHYDVHSLYGLSESRATYQTMEDMFPGKRHLILARSTYPGSGQYASHWLGDNKATWQDMRSSIVGMLEFNLFIIPHVGADICGFDMSPSEELCARWMQLGAFYPFSRNHNAASEDQDPARPDWPIVNAVSRDVLLLRYKYLPYLYTLFHKASMHGGSVVRPLFNIFPSDVSARDVDDQFFWGDGLMVAPVLHKGKDKRQVYFPQGLWYDLVEGTLAASGPLQATVDAPIQKIPVYVRGGVILPNQEPDVTTFRRYTIPMPIDSRFNPFGLTIALDSMGSASGSLYWDDGESVHTMSTSYMANYAFTNNKLNTTIKHGEDLVGGLILGHIQIMGYPSNPEDVKVNGQSQDSSIWTYSQHTRVLVLTVNTPMGKNLIVELL